MTRRRILRFFLAAGGVVLGTRAASLLWLDRKADRITPGTLPPTPACEDGEGDPTESVTQGPFFKPSSPDRSVLREAGTVGTPLVIEGRVLSPDCRPISGAVVDVWNCDGEGVYDNEGFKLRGHQHTGASGAFRVETVKPGSYRDSGILRTPHVHVRVQAPGTALLSTQLFFPGEPLNARDHLIRESLIMDVRKSGGGGLVGRFDIVLA